MDVDKEFLYRFFNQELSLEEENILQAWLEESEDNRHTFLSERKLYDAIILRGKVEVEGEEEEEVRHFPWRILTISTAVAAVVAFISITASIYFMNQSFRSERMNIVDVPQGQRTTLILNDGTKVCLNAQTHLEYPQSFKPYDQRNVKLDGEAYFEVNKDKKHPFIVMTPHGKITVTGTKFYVESYSSSRSFETTLMEGKVNVSNDKEQIDLLPNERCVLKSGKLVCEAITDYDVYRWIEGLYCFKDMPLKNVLNEFEKYYNVRFIMKGDVPNTQITGKFRLIDGVDFALKVLQRGIKFKFKRDVDSNIVYIY